MKALELLQGQGLLLSDGGGAVGEEDRADGGIGHCGDGVAEGLGISFIAAATNGVGEAVQSHGSDLLIFLEIEGGDVASGADGFVVNGVDAEGVGGECIAANAIGDHIVERDGAVDIRIGLKGVGVPIKAGCNHAVIG